MEIRTAGNGRVPRHAATAYLWVGVICCGVSIPLSLMRSGPSSRMRRLLLLGETAAEPKPALYTPLAAPAACPLPLPCAVAVRSAGRPTTRGGLLPPPPAVRGIVVLPW